MGMVTGAAEGEAVGDAVVVGEVVADDDPLAAVIGSAPAGVANPKEAIARASVAAADAADTPNRALIFMKSPVAVRRG